MKYYIAVVVVLALMVGIFIGAIYKAFIDESTGYTPSDLDIECMNSVESR